MFICVGVFYSCSSWCDSCPTGKLWHRHSNRSWFGALSFMLNCSLALALSTNTRSKRVRNISQWHKSPPSALRNGSQNSSVLSPVEFKCRHDCFVPAAPLLPLTFRFKSGCHCAATVNIWPHDTSMNAWLIVEQLRWRRHSRVSRGCRSCSLNRTCGEEERWHIRAGAAIGWKQVCGWKGCQETN